MKAGKRFLAGILSAILVLSSVQLPANIAYAQELPIPQENITEEESTVQEPGQMQDDGETKQEPGGEMTDAGEGEKPGTQDDQEPVDGNEEAGEDTPAQTEPPAQEEKPADQETPSDQEAEEPADQISGDEGDEESPKEETGDEGEAPDGEGPADNVTVSENDLQVSGNDLLTAGEQEVWVEAELEGAYQFGGAPLGQDSDSPYAISAYSESEVEEYLYEQMRARRTQISVAEFGIPVTDIGNVVVGVLNENPDLYFVKKGFRYSSMQSVVAMIMIEYEEGLDDAKWRSGANAALASVRPGMSDLEKIITLHDYLAVNCEYDKENLDLGADKVPNKSHSTYGVFADGTAVCDGYALAYKYLLNQQGIECYMVTSTAMAHAWNMVVLDGEYYQEDVTWDDPTWDRVGGAGHNYMLRSDAAFEGHYNWQVTKGSQVVDFKAVSTRFDNAFWAGCRSPLVIAEESCYYTAYSGRPCIKKTSLSDITAAGTVVTYIDPWIVWGGGGTWQGVYSGLFRIGDRLYYNDKSKIYSIAMDGTDQKAEFTADTTDGYIYGSGLSRGKVLYALHKDPNELGFAKETVLEAVIDAGSVEPDPPVEEDKALNLDNPLLHFTALDDTTISSSAEGRPKLLIFYSNTCGNSRGTIREISGKIGSFSGIDICAIEVTKQSKADVVAFQKTYGCEEIVFSYDTGDNNADGMWQYAWAVGNNQISWPIICYIDADNRLQYYTLSYCSADTVLSNLKKYCNAVLGEGNHGFDAKLKVDTVIYNGEEQRPKAVVSAQDPVSLEKGIVLVEGQDYEMSYENNRNAGTATAVVTGINSYSGTIRMTFEIRPAELRIRAKDKTIRVGTAIPPENAYEYEIIGLMGTDELLRKPVLTCSVTDTKVPGRYDIIPSGADAGANYTITYENGRLTVAQEETSCTVIFDVRGRGTAPAPQIGIKVGGTVARPADPKADGYRFDGWYRDAACTKAWNFETDTVQTDITLYAKWLENGKEEGGFAFQEIGDVYYTGSACKPAVSVYDGDVLLKSGRDYQIKYYNNINANKDGELKRGNGEGANFNPELPYVEIIGKGNYTDAIKNNAADAVKVNFNILRASIGDGQETPAAGITLKVSEQLVTAGRAQKPFSSIKYRKGMKQGTDFELRLISGNAHDGAGNSLVKGEELPGAEIPEGCEGEFYLTIEGTGNYMGSISRKISVADKAHLMKNAKITLGKNLKNIAYTGGDILLTPSETASPDTFTVKCGSVILKPGRDYTVKPVPGKVGKAELVIVGNGEYVGTKTAAFSIKGKTFSAKAVRVSGVEDKTYTGKAVTQNDAVLTYLEPDGGETPLRYGTDYTITYTPNINRGNVTMTFRGAEEKGYSGSFKKSFRIEAVDIADKELVNCAAGMENMVFPYCKAGVKPVEEIVLTNGEGFALRNGRDYTLAYKNNKEVAEASAEKPPTVTVKGKGNYTGKFDVTFRITKSGLKHAYEDGHIQYKATAVSYNPDKAEEYAYKPAVKLTDGKSALRVNKDYEIQYLCNTQKEYLAYLAAYEAGSGSEEKLGEMMPRAVITAKEGSSYEADGEIVVPLPVYRTKLVKSNLQIDLTEKAVYTGKQVRPAVAVRDTIDGKTLQKGKDYEVSYGANNQSGKNKGSVTITGIAPEYGGSVTVKFDIEKKVIEY